MYKILLKNTYIQNYVRRATVVCCCTRVSQLLNKYFTILLCVRTFIPMFDLTFVVAIWSGTTHTFNIGTIRYTQWLSFSTEFQNAILVGWFWLFHRLNKKKHGGLTSSWNVQWTLHQPRLHSHPRYSFGYWYLLFGNLNDGSISLLNLATNWSNVWYPSSGFMSGIMHGTKCLTFFSFRVPSFLFIIRHLLLMLPIRCATLSMEWYSNNSMMFAWPLVCASSNGVCPFLAGWFGENPARHRASQEA